MIRKHDSEPQQVAADQTRIVDIMTRGAVTVSPDLGIEPLIELFLERGLSRAPVVDDGGRLIGMVSKTDVVIDQYQRDDTEVDQSGAGGPGRHVYAERGFVRDIMTPVAFALPDTTSVGEAARRMIADNVHAVPVTSGGKVVGILSSMDVMAWVAGVELAQPAPRSPS